MYSYYKTILSAYLMTTYHMVYTDFQAFTPRYDRLRFNTLLDRIMTPRFRRNMLYFC
jgi:hypothetical protein